MTKALHALRCSQHGRIRALHALRCPQHGRISALRLEALSHVSLMGKITGSEALLLILDAIRESGDSEE